MVHWKLTRNRLAAAFSLLVVAGPLAATAACGDDESGQGARTPDEGGAGAAGGSGGAPSAACDPACSAGQLCSVLGSCISAGTCLADGDCPAGTTCDTMSKACAAGAAGSGGSPGSGGGSGLGGSPSHLVNIVAYQATEDQKGNEIYVMNIDGSAKTRLTINDEEDIEPAWSPDGTWITFTSDRDGNLEIYRMSRTGNEVTRLTNSNDADRLPVVSPDGLKIAFVSNRDGNDEIYVMSADGTAVSRLTNQAQQDTDPAFSPDGTRIFFVSKRDDAKGEVYSMSATDGSAVTRLTQNGATDAHPAVSWSGEFVAFASDRDSQPAVSELFQMNANNGTSVTKISTGQDTNYQFPAWSRDGSQIIFAMGDSVPANFPSGPLDRCEMPGVPVLCYYGHERCCLEHSFNKHTCDWMIQRGYCIAASRHIYIMSANGGAVTQLTTHSTGQADHPSVAWGDPIGSGGAGGSGG